MSYQVTYTETNNPLKPPIIVEDQTVNSQTDLSFVGKNYSGYGPLLAENFLHLLENFASPTKPVNPVQGQLWFDNNDSVSQLMVNIDGTSNGWVSAGGIKKSPSTPSASSSIQGDLWVDTINQQVSLYSGSSWLLVGPAFSAGSQTGPKLETITDVNNISHTVQSIYVENNRVAIISNSTFIPKSTQTGFKTVGKGVNLNTVASGEAYKFYGTTGTADSLTDSVSGSSVTLSSLLRSDQPSTTNFGLNIRSSSGLTVGSDTGNLSLFTDTGSNTAVFYARTGNSMEFRVNYQTSGPQTVLHIDSNLNVGINKTTPTTSLDVAGVIQSDTQLNINGTADVGAVGGASIATLGGLTVAKQSLLGDDVTFKGQQFFDYRNSSNVQVAASVLSPSVDNLYDIGGNPALGGTRFANVWANNFHGTFNGTFTGGVTGNVSGTATKLSTPLTLSFAGDIASNSITTDGSSITSSDNVVQTNATAVFTTQITSSAITNQTELSDSQLADEILVYRAGSASLNKMAKSTFISNIALVPIGAIMPFPGTTPPNGFLLCDGSEVLIKTYGALYNIVQSNYVGSVSLAGAATFRLPDLRGRFPLGADNMNNNITVPSKDGSGTLISTVGATASRVVDSANSAKTIGGSAGQYQVTLQKTNLPDHKHSLKGSAGAQYFAVRTVAGTPADEGALSGVGGQAAGQAQYLTDSGTVIPDQNTTLGQAINTMNPYLTMNYIIYTGVYL